MTTKHSLWLIDDDPALRLILEDSFSDAGLQVQAFSNAKGAWARLNSVLNGSEPEDILPDVILTDIRMPMMDGLSFSQWMHTNFPSLPVIIMTAHSDLKSAVDSYDTGAFEYLPKPFDLDHAICVVKKAITTNPAAALVDNAIVAEDSEVPSAASDKKEAMQRPNTTPSSEIKKQPATKKGSPVATKASAASESTPIIGQSPAMQTVFRAIGRLASSPITVLITGESGTGKELVAGALHQNSPRQKKPFIALNMAAIPHELIESELFGHEKGAFTGATTLRHGRFEQANGGTLFLDEIGDMPFSTQTRLLRVLANGEFFRVGGQKPITVDVRIIAATHQNLEQLVKEGKFREDLFYRLNVIRLPLPPLRARPDDIPDLVEFFMSKAATEMKTDKKQLTTEALHIMQAFDWPGNVRQLENACRWITVMATGERLGVEDLPPDLTEFAQHYLAHAANPEALEGQGMQTLSNLPNNSPGFAAPSTTASAASYTQGNSPSFAATAQSDEHRQTSTASVTITPPALVNSAHSWQDQLQNWAHTALQQGQTEILQQATPTFEKILIRVALEYSKGRKGEAADLLGWGRNTLTRKIKLLGLEGDQ